MSDIETTAEARVLPLAEPVSEELVGALIALEDGLNSLGRENLDLDARKVQIMAHTSKLSQERRRLYGMIRAQYGLPEGSRFAIEDGTRLIRLQTK